MKKSIGILVGIFAFCGMRMHAQSAGAMDVEQHPVVQVAAQDSVYEVAERMPEFPNGQARLFRFIYSNLQYPPMEAARRHQDRVICQFVVEKDGRISDVHVVKSKGYADLDKEAVRVISSMPNWHPGEHNGQPVRVKMTVPLQFKLEPIVVQPTYPGGADAQLAYIQKNMKYPKDAKKALQEGTAVCQFKVEADGSISEPVVFVSTGVESLDNEAIRLLQSMPKWTPGTLDEQPTAMQAAMIISFALPAEYINKQTGVKVDVTAEVEGRTVEGKLPMPACREKVNGVVRYKVLIGTDGKVVSVRNGEGDLMDNPELLELTRKTALKAQFNAAEQESVGTITFTFFSK